MTEVVIVDAIRSPIGRAFKGSLKDVRPDDLGGMLVKAIMERNPGVPPESIEDLLCGVSGAAGPQGYNLGRIVGQLGGLPNTVPGTSVNRFCASSLQAVKMAHNAIMADEGDTILVLGVESVSRRGTAFTADDFNPRFVDESRPDFVNHMYIDNVDTAENVSKKYGVSREDQDALAYQSQMRASKASEDGTFAREIVGIQTEAGLVTKDDGPRPQTTMEKLAELKPLKGEGGTVTAGNACPMNDGASAALIMSADRAKTLGLKPRARILGSYVSGLEPELMGVGPISSTEALFKRKGVSIGDVDVVELNEAFAAQVVAVCRELGIDMETQLNPFGGAIALGHPFGMTGVRMVTTLLNGLETRDGTLGLVTQCIGGGQGMSMLIERVA